MVGHSLEDADLSWKGKQDANKKMKDVRKQCN